MGSWEKLLGGLGFRVVYYRTAIGTIAFVPYQKQGSLIVVKACPRAWKALFNSTSLNLLRGLSQQVKKEKLELVYCF